MPAADGVSGEEAKSEEQFKKRATVRTRAIDPVTPRFCLHCGRNVANPGDVCEACGRWLLTGRCVFCTAVTTPGTDWCGQCGNAPDGAACPRCGAVSIFDYCSGCGAAVTERAHETERSLARDPVVLELAETLLTCASDPVSDSDISEAEADPWAATDPAILAPLAAAARAASAAAANAGNASASERVARDETVQRLLRQVQQRSFETGQDARLFFNALRIVVSHVGPSPEPTAWLCNAYGNHHPVPPGPNACADPSRGGEYVFHKVHHDLVIDF